MDNRYNKRWTMKEETNSNIPEPVRFEASSERDRCDKWIAWIHSCRECLFNVLCRFNSFYKNKDGKEKNPLWDLD